MLGGISRELLKSEIIVNQYTCLAYHMQHLWLRQYAEKRIESRLFKTKEEI